MVHGVRFTDNGAGLALTARETLPTRVTHLAPSAGPSPRSGSVTAGFSGWGASGAPAGNYFVKSARAVSNRCMQYLSVMPAVKSMALSSSDSVHFLCLDGCTKLYT